MKLTILKNKEKILEFVRFCTVGVIAAAIHYGIYYLLQRYINLNIAYTIGYIFSFICNFFLTSYLTFRSKPSLKKAIGFGGSHILNYVNHMLLFNLFLYMGISKEMAPIVVLAIVVPINFLLLRWVFKHRDRDSKLP